MKRSDVRTFIQDEVLAKQNAIDSYNAEIRALIDSPIRDVLNRVAQDDTVPVEDIYYIGQSEYDDQWTLTFRLSPGREDSSLVRGLVRSLGTPAVKRPAEHEPTLESIINLGTVTVRVTNYLPETCRVEYEDVVVPEHVERKAKVVCSEPDDDTGEEVNPEEVP